MTTFSAMSTMTSRALSLLTVGALTLAACGGDSDSADGGASDGEELDASSSDSDAAEIDEASDAPDASDASEDSGSELIDPVFPHVSAEAPPNSYGPLCNPDNERNWARDWRISVPEGWTFASSGGSSSFYDIGFNTPDGFVVEVDWTESIDSFGFTDGVPAGDVDFDGESVTVMDSSDETNTILSIDYIAQSAGAFVEFQGNDVALNQVAITAPVEAGFGQDELTSILTTMRRERCAILGALSLENAFQLGAVLPIFEGGDPLGKTLPTSERLPFDIAQALDPLAAYTDDQLAYIVGFDQATSECFVANVRATRPTDMNDPAIFINPVTPESVESVAAMQAALTDC